jgi:acetyl-CoA acetyltransferase
VNRLCGSSLDAAIVASRQIALGEADVIVAGGVESMSRAPWVLPKPEKPYPAGDATLVSTALGWRLVNPRMNPEWTVSLGEATELLRVREKVSREAQDAFALRSHQTAARAWDTGFYDNLVVEVPGVALGRDESIRSDTGLEKLTALKPVFRKDRDGDRGQLLSAQRRRVRGPAGQPGGAAARRPAAAGPDRWSRCRGERPPVLRLRAGPGGQHGPEAGRHRLG